MPVGGTVCYIPYVAVILTIHSGFRSYHYF